MGISLLELYRIYLFKLHLRRKVLNRSSRCSTELWSTKIVLNTMQKFLFQAHNNAWYYRNTPTFTPSLILRPIQTPWFSVPGCARWRKRPYELMSGCILRRSRRRTCSASFVVLNKEGSMINRMCTKHKDRAAETDNRKSLLTSLVSCSVIRAGLRWLVNSHVEEEAFLCKHVKAITLAEAVRF